MAEKSEWKWDPEKKTIINPLSRELDELEIVDNDYDFSVAFNVELNTTEDSTNTTNKKPGKMTATELALSKMNLVLNGEDADSVSTLGNPLSPKQLQKRASSLMANPSPSVSPTNKSDIQGVTTPQSLAIASSGTSVRSALTLDSRVSALEDQLSLMEDNINKNMTATLESLFSRINNTSQPPGGASAGGPDG